MAKILYVGTAGSDDPTRAGLPFNFAMGALDAGHRPEIFLAGEAAYLKRDSVLGAVQPVALPLGGSGGPGLRTANRTLSA